MFTTYYMYHHASIHTAHGMYCCQRSACHATFAMDYNAAQPNTIQDYIMGIIKLREDPYRT